MGHKYGLGQKEGGISEENAFKEVLKLLQRYNIDVDKMEEGSKIKKASIETIDAVLSDFMSGHLEVKEEKGQIKVIQNIQNPSQTATISQLVYREMEFEDQTAMDPNTNQYQRMRDLLSSMCETEGGFAIIKNLKSADAKTAGALALLFLL